MSKTRQIDKIQCAKTLILSLQQVRMIYSILCMKFHTVYHVMLLNSSGEVVMKKVLGKAGRNRFRLKRFVQLFEKLVKAFLNIVLLKSL